MAEHLQQGKHQTQRHATLEDQPLRACKLLLDMIVLSSLRCLSWTLGLLRTRADRCMV